MVCEPITFILLAYSARRPMHTSWYVWKVHEMCETENNAHGARGSKVTDLVIEASPCKPKSCLCLRARLCCRRRWSRNFERNWPGTLTERQTSQTPDSGGTFERMMHDFNKLCMSAHTTARGKLTKDKSSDCLRLRIESVLSQKSDGLLDST